MRVRNAYTGRLSRSFWTFLIAVLTGATFSRPAAAKEFLGINLGPTPSEVPTRSFRDDTAAAIAGSLLLKYNASEARVVAARWFQAAREALPALAQSNPLPPVDINVAIANSLFANMTEAAGEALSAFLPDHVGPDNFASNYSQAFIPGLVTALRGVRYEPCLLRGASVGAAVSAAGVVINPELFATRPTGAAVVATGLRIRPALLVVEPTAAAGVAIGGLVAPTLITIIPTHVSVRDVGLQANPALIKVGQSPNVPISGPEGADKSSMRSPSPSGPLASNGGSGSGASSGGSGGGAEESIAPGLTFSLLP